MNRNLFRVGLAVVAMLVGCEPSARLLQPSRIVDFPSDAKSTPTGLARLADGQWLVANDGRADDEDRLPDTSLLIVASDWSSVVSRVDLRGLNTTTLQGAAASERHYFVAAPDLRSIFSIDRTTLAIEARCTLAYRPNALTLDATGNFMVGRFAGELSDKTVEVVSPVCKMISSFTLPENPDHFLLSKGDLLYTFGKNRKAGFLGVYNTKTQTLGATYELAGSEAIEGLSEADGEIYVLNDGRFHKAGGGKNIVAVYNLPMAE